MIIIGHPFIDFSAFEKIATKEEIKDTSSNATVVFNFSEKNVALCHYAEQNAVAFALVVKEEKEVVFAAALGASYIICEKELAQKAQKFADDYLFDAKILLQSKTDEDIVYAATHSIDGVLFEKGIKDGSR